jgi:glyoxylase-like metal-dependent hydrolase (beta-lactamase superfamily II)
MEGLQFKVLYLGGTYIHKNDLVKTNNVEEIVISPHYAILIKHPQLGNILFDTGDDDNWEQSYSEYIKSKYPMVEFISLGDELSANNLTYSDIDTVILSHLHFDHAGGLKHFSGEKAGRKVYVSEEEARELFYQTILNPEDLAPAYIQSQYESIPGIAYYPIRDVIRLADDITLFVQKCHTPGVIGLVLTLADGGNIIITSDTIYTRESYDRELPPGGSINKTQSEFYNNLEMVKGMQESLNAVLFFGHDDDQAKDWKEKQWISSIEQVAE